MSDTSTDPTVSQVLAALRAVHERFSAAVGPPADPGRPSYDDGWSVAQVASHLGSGAEIFLPYLAAGAAGEPAPGGERNQAVWDAWNAKPPARQVADSVEANERFIEAAAALTDGERDRWRLEVFGLDQDLTAFLRMRLNEYAVHTWDVTVALDPASTIHDDAVGLVVDGLAAVVGWAGRPVDEKASVEVRTTGPERAFHLDLGPSGVALAPSLDDTSAAELELPAEAFVRLVYGRLDPDHTPASVCARGVGLDLLRRAFPGL